MTLQAVATRLNIPTRVFERESAEAWIDRRLLTIESELVLLAHRYGAKSATEFLRHAKKGKIDDTAESIDDFFKLDHLEAEQKRLRALKETL